MADRYTMVSGRQPWRKRILDAISQLFKGNTNPLYGLEHALQVEAEIRKGIRSIAVDTEHLDLPVVLAAALLHDVGFAQRKETWTLDRAEHVPTGIVLALEILRNTPGFRASSTRTEKVLRLIDGHDTTTHSYPSIDRPGDRVECPFLTDSSETIALALLRESDAIVHGSSNNLSLHIDEWLQSGLPLVPEDTNPITTWQWMDSVAGNIRLLARRVLIDAFTESGKTSAQKSYDRLERWVQATCNEHGLDYTPEPELAKQRRDALHCFGDKRFAMQLIDYRGWVALAEKLRSVTLLYDGQLFPYREAVLSSEIVPLASITSMALYVLQNRLDEIAELQDALMIGYGLSLFDLPGLLTFWYNDLDIQTIAPPIIEVYDEEYDDKQSERIIGLIDGLHRCMTARQLGFSGIRAAVIAGAAYPLVPKPVKWEQVKAYDNPPSQAEKRHYRFTRIEEFPFDEYPFISSVNQQNFQYFFFRDLGSLGSQGKRDFHEYDDKRAG